MTVYRYGVPTRVGGGPDSDPDGIPWQLDVQLRLAHGVHIALVASEREYQDALKAVWSSRPEVAAAEDRIRELETQLQNMAAGGGAAPGSGCSDLASYAPVRAQLRQARACRRDLLTAAKPLVQGELDAISARSRTAVKALYADFVQHRGLYWATFNDVREHLRAAVRRVAERRGQGQSAQLRAHEWDGSGSIAVQLRRPVGAPARTPGRIADGETGRWRNDLVVPWVDPEQWDPLSRAEQRRRGRGQVRFRIATREWLTLPVVLHRMLPAVADITGAHLVVTRQGGHRRVELQITARLPDPPSRPLGAVVALHPQRARSVGTGPLPASATPC